MAAAEEFRSRAEDLERQIGLEISVAQLNYESALMSIDVGRAMEAAAEEDHRMAMKRYAAGVGTNIDVLDAAVALTNVRNRLAESIYDTRKARAEHDWTMGISGKTLSYSFSASSSYTGGTRSLLEAANPMLTLFRLKLSWFPLSNSKKKFHLRPA